MYHIVRYDIIISNAMNDQKTILIIDDEAAFREIFSTKLASAGYHVETAAGGNEGIAKVKELKPDLVLLDEVMPNMSGGEVLTKLRGDSSTCFTKIIFLTNFGDPRDGGIDERIARKNGADGYIRKTDDLSKLVVLVEDCVNKCRPAAA